MQENMFLKAFLESSHLRRSIRPLLLRFRSAGLDTCVRTDPIKSSNISNLYRLASESRTSTVCSCCYGLPTKSIGLFQENKNLRQYRSPLPALLQQFFPVLCFMHNYILGWIMPVCLKGLNSYYFLDDSGKIFTYYIHGRRVSDIIYIF